MPTYENLIDTSEVSLAIEQLYVADSSVTWSPTRVIGPHSPPAGFVHLGAVVEDSPSLATTRERFQLTLGIPNVLQYQAVRALTGTFTCGFHSMLNQKARYALGNVAQLKTVVGSFTNAVAITSIDTLTRVFIGTASMGSFAVGDYVSAGTDQTELTRGDIEAEVAALNDATPDSAPAAWSNTGHGRPA